MNGENVNIYDQFYSIPCNSCSN